MQDGTLSTIKGSLTVVRDLKDICFHSYFSIMDDLRLHHPPNEEPYEIRSATVCSSMPTTQSMDSTYLKALVIFIFLIFCF